MVVTLSSTLLSDPVTRMLLTALFPLLLGFGIGVFAARRHLDWILSALRTVRLARQQGNREAMLRSLGGILGEVAGLVALVAVLLSITRQISLLDGVPGIRGVPFWLVAGFLAALAFYAVQYRRLERHADDAVASTSADSTPVDPAVPTDLAREAAPAVAATDSYAGFTDPFAPALLNPSNAPVPPSPGDLLPADDPVTVFLPPPGADASDLFTPSLQAVEAALGQRSRFPCFRCLKGS
jgi:hypothetical protein